MKTQNITTTVIIMVFNLLLLVLMGCQKKEETQSVQTVEKSPTLSRPAPRPPTDKAPAEPPVAMAPETTVPPHHEVFRLSWPAPWPPTDKAPAEPPVEMAPETTVPPHHEVFSAIDRILEGMGFGNIAFNAPESMNLNDTVVIHLILGLTKPIDELKRMIEAEGAKESAHIRVANRMEARLSGPNFTITAITPEVQALSQNDVTEWKWEVKPNTEGRQYLHLTLSALLSVDGVSTPRAIRTFDRMIEVEVTWLQRISSFFKENWQWLWAAILVPLAGWLWKKKKKEKRKLNGNQD